MENNFNPGDFVERVTTNWKDITIGEVAEVTKVSSFGIRLKDKGNYYYSSKAFKLCTNSIDVVIHQIRQEVK